MYNLLEWRTNIPIESTEKAFSAALNFARNAYGKKFQARVCEISGAHPPNLSAMLNRGGGCSEELRRKIRAGCR